MDETFDSQATPAVISAHHLTVSYGRTPVVWDVSLSLPQGILLGIVGPNGAGKSTFLKALLGLIPPLSGQVEFFGGPLRRKEGKVAYVPQKESVDWDFPITVEELVLMGCYGRTGMFRWPSKKEKERAYSCLCQVGMEGYCKRQISQLSGGQQQRVFLARALLQDAEIYLMDEPFSGVDLATEQALMEILRDLRNQGKTILVVHHNLNSVESYFDWLMVLNMRLVACGPVREVFTREVIKEAYGAGGSLLDDALKLSSDQQHGAL